jgi:hypothetical protein
VSLASTTMASAGGMARTSILPDVVAVLRPFVLDAGVA